MAGVIAGVATAAILALAVPGNTPMAGAADDPTARLLALVNDERSARGLPPLDIDDAANDHAARIAAEQRDAGQLSHTPPDELASWYLPPYDQASEALGMAGDGNADSIHEAWMAHAQHRDLLMLPGADHVGVAAVAGSGGALWAVLHVLDGPQGTAAAPAPSDSENSSSPTPTAAPAPAPAPQPAPQSSEQVPPSSQSSSPSPAPSLPLAAPTGTLTGSSPHASSTPESVRRRAAFTEAAGLHELQGGATVPTRNLADTESSCDGTGCREVRGAGRTEREGGVMYHFAVIALLALATVKLVDFVSDNVRQLERMRSLLTFVVAIGGIWILDYALFEGWAIDVRNHDVALWITGFVVAGLTVPWRALFGYLSHHRATADETLGVHMPIRKAA